MEEGEEIVARAGLCTVYFAEMQSKAITIPN